MLDGHSMTMPRDSVVHRTARPVTGYSYRFLSGRVRHLPDRGFLDSRRKTALGICGTTASYVAREPPARCATDYSYRSLSNGVLRLRDKYFPDSPRRTSPGTWGTTSSD